MSPDARPDLADPEGALVAGHVLIDGRVVTNPRSQVRADASVVIRPPRALRGEDKLRAALDGFAVDVTDRECVDLGASAGGFTRVLLEHGARRVFAVDAGHGQLRGDLRNHSRVVNLERTNLGDLSAIPPDTPIAWSRWTSRTSRWPTPCRRSSRYRSRPTPTWSRS